MKPKPEHELPPSAERGHETRDLSVKVLAGAGLAVLVFLIAAHLVAGLVFKLSADERRRTDPSPLPLFDTKQLATGPLLQVWPTRDLEEMKAAEKDALNSYGWVDRNAGVVRIPIDKAMDALLQRGLPVRKVPQSGPAAGGKS